MRTPRLIIPLALAAFVAAPAAAEQQPLPPASSPPSASELDRGTTPQQKAMVGMPVVSSDGRELGIVSTVLTGETGDILAIYISVGAFLGMGERLVEVDNDEFLEFNGRIQLTLSEQEVFALPEVKDQA